MIGGFATDAGTAEYRRRLTEAAPGHFRSWRGLTVSSLGIGTYLGAEDDATDRAYRDAIVRAVEVGINVVDSAVNYRHQRSERAVGRALAALVAAGRATREQIVLATKGGFLPFDGAVPSNPGAYLAETYVRPGLLRPEELVAGCHCLAPRFLADQLDRSRANLGVETIDVYYVHNPEMQLSAVDRQTFHARMRAAFECLERAVSDGSIRCYGTATWNGYRRPPDAPDHLSLEELVRLAGEIGGDAHHFRVLQLPYNLAMTEAFATANQRVGREMLTLLEAAARLECYVMSSASIYQGQLARGLPEVVGRFLPGLKTDAQRALQFARSTPGLGTALVGMKRLAHVEENGRLAAVPPVPEETFRKMFQGA